MAGSNCDQFPGPRHVHCLSAVRLCRSSCLSDMDRLCVRQDRQRELTSAPMPYRGTPSPVLSSTQPPAHSPRKTPCHHSPSPPFPTHPASQPILAQVTTGRFRTWLLPLNQPMPVSSCTRVPFEQQLGQAIRELAAPIDVRDASVKIGALLVRLLPEPPLPGNASRQRRRALVLAVLTAARRSRGLGRALRRQRPSRLEEPRVLPNGLPCRSPGSSPVPHPLVPPSQSSGLFAADWIRYPAACLG
jgi:hypothetical protein